MDFLSHFYHFCLLALPVTFKQKLKNLQVEEGYNITLYCEISKPGVPVEWRLGGESLENGDKYQIKQRDTAAELIIRDADPEDSGVYTCVCREQRTKATVKVIGMSNVQTSSHVGCVSLLSCLRPAPLLLNTVSVWFQSCSSHL